MAAVKGVWRRCQNQQSATSWTADHSGCFPHPRHVHGLQVKLHSCNLSVIVFLVLIFASLRLYRNQQTALSN